MVHYFITQVKKKTSNKKLDYRLCLCLIKQIYKFNFWAINSVGECYLHTVEVTGSIPVSPIYQPLHFFGAAFFVPKHIEMNHKTCKIMHHDRAPQHYIEDMQWLSPEILSQTGSTRQL